MTFAVVAALLGPVAVGRADTGPDSAGPPPAEVVQAILANVATLPAEMPLPPAVASPLPSSDPLPLVIAATPDAAPAVAVATEAPPEPPAEPASEEIEKGTDGDIAPVLLEPARVSPPDLQGGAENLNISIRIASPGTAGAVMQRNAVVAAAIHASAVTAATVRPEPQQPRSEAISPARPAARPADTAVDTTSDLAPLKALEVPTDLFCDSAQACCAIEGPEPLPNGCSPVDTGELTRADILTLIGALTGIQGDNFATNEQYRTGAVQYRPVNVNISIRIGSPGNDGPVTQTNLVQVTTNRVQVVHVVSVGVVHLVAPLLAPMSDLHPPAQPAAVHGWSTADGDTFGTLGPAVDDGSSVAARANLETKLAPVVGLPWPPPPSALRFTPIAPVVPAISRSTLAPRPSRSPILTGAARESASVGTPSARAAARSEGARRRAHAPAPPAPPTKTWSSSGTAVVPTPPSSGGGGGLPIALFLPFVLAVLDTGVRRVRGAAAVPQQPVERRPERPG